MTDRITAWLLISSTVIFISIGLVLAASGNLVAMYANPDGLAVSPIVRRWSFRFAILAMVVALIGFVLLSSLLRTAGDATLATVALTIFIPASLGWILEMTITSSVGELAARDFIQTGTLPDYWEPIHYWANISLQQTYVSIGLIALAFYGWSLLRTGLTPAWAGWVTIGLSIFWFILAVVFAITSSETMASYFIPGVLLLTPTIIGIGLLTD